MSITNISGFYHSVKILETMDLDEYIALPSAKSQVIDLIISGNRIDLNTDSQTRKKLRSYFPVGTKTNTNFTVLLGEPL